MQGDPDICLTVFQSRGSKPVLTRESRSLERAGQRQARLRQGARGDLDRYVQQARAAGATWQVIGIALGITRQSAWERFRSVPGCAARGPASSRLPRPPAQRSLMKEKLAGETDKRAQRMRAGGATWQAIGTALGITRQSAWERFRDVPGCAAKASATSSSRRPTTAQKLAVKTEERVKRMRAEGATWQVIGTALGITRQSAWERFRPTCAYQKDQGIPGKVLQARYRQPHIFADWVTDAAKTDRSIKQWLETPDVDLGMMADFGGAVPPIRLLGKATLRDYLMTIGRSDITPAPPGSASCPICGQMYLNKRFLATHQKRDHRTIGTRC
jgi:hypothetical protein